ncbi:MAG TPA: cyclase family protein [Gemmataceae bacterium]|nr:cyclase family protein [Gemmataceae bacterium]
MWLKRLAVCSVLIAASSWCGPAAAGPKAEAPPQFLDLSLLVAPELPCTWPAGWAPFHMNHYQRIGRLSPYNSDILMIDENTGTQFDAPAHSIPPPGSGFPNAGPLGKITGDKAPVWQFVGEACVVDCRDLRDAAPKGQGALVKKENVTAWEKKHRRVGPGDVVLFASGYSDTYYKPLPAGRRFLADPLEGTSPGWPDPDPACMEYLAGRKVMTLGTDSPSMGPLPGEMAAASHLAGLKHGMIWTEGATCLGKLPTTGAFYCTVGVKHVGGVGAEGRAFAIVGNPLAKQLIEAARAKRVVDLSVLLAQDLPVWWPGRGVGRHRQPYFRKTLYTFEETKGNGFGQTHILDSHTGTHLVPPAYALPRKGFDNHDYAPRVRQWLAEYEDKYGPRGTSDITTDKVPLSQTCGWTRLIDVKDLIGTTDKKDWPASPEITKAHIQAYERQHGGLKPGDVVIFHSGYSDRFFKPFPQGDKCMADPLNGKSEGWPAPGPDAIVYLADKGIRCVATDGPTLGGAEPKRALMTYWALGSKGMVGVEYLTNAAKLPAKTYFIFAAVKVRGCHGGPGRAIALY